MSDFGYGGITLYAGTFQFPHLSSKVPQRGPTTPGASSRFGLLRVRSPLLTQSLLFSFPPVTEMFHFTGCRVSFPIFVQERTVTNYHHQVTPFGNLRIKAFVPLPEAYRSLSRPSSPVSTKASTVCPKKLDSFRSGIRPAIASLAGGNGLQNHSYNLFLVPLTEPPFSFASKGEKFLNFLSSPCGCQRAGGCLFFK